MLHESVLYDMHMHTPLCNHARGEHRPRSKTPSPADCHGTRITQQHRQTRM